MGRKGAQGEGPPAGGPPLPSQYPTVAADVLAFCRPRPGLWVDVGAGPGGLGLALAEQTEGGAIVLLDPRADALGKALAAADERCLRSRVAAALGCAEAMPLPDGCADLVVSRGSVFFWRDAAQGVREALRVLRPGGRAMLGGGLGTGYPAWARREFIRRQRESQRRKGPEAMRRFREARRPEAFDRIAREAGIPRFAVRGEGGLDEDDPDAGVGVWLMFSKE